MADLQLNIRQSNGEQFEVTVAATATVLQLKQAAEAGSKLPPDQQRLIFKGRILKDEQTLESYKIENGSQVHLVKAKAAGTSGPATDADSTAAATTDSANAQPNPFAGMGGMPGMGGMGGFPGMGGMGGFPGMGGMGGMGGMPNLSPEMIQGMMNNPMVQQMMSDPAMLQQMIQSNPMLQQMAQSNPMIG